MTKIISDLKDIPEEYYENIINLINGFKYGTQGVFKNNGANTTTIFSYLKDNTNAIEFCNLHGLWGENKND